MNSNMTTTTPTAGATTSSGDRLLTFVETCLDGYTEKTFFRQLTTDDVQNLRSLNTAWRASEELEWAANGPGRDIVLDHCHFSAPAGHLVAAHGLCPYAQTTPRSQLQWCETHGALWGRPAVAMCPQHAGPLAPGATLRGYQGPMCQFCHMDLRLREQQERVLETMRTLREIRG